MSLLGYRCLKNQHEKKQNHYDDLPPAREQSMPQPTPRKFWPRQQQEGAV
jgi:hypothetical protein